MKHLLFQIAAPLMSFGGAGAKQERGTDGHPSKGFALGFLGAALGKKRDDPWHDLSKDLGFATLTILAGSRLEDYHTVATPRGTDQYATRRQEAEASDYTVETWREYLCDAYFVCAFWGDSVDLGECQQALIHPTFELFAGRKSCPLSLPPAPGIVDEKTLALAFRAYCKVALYKPLCEEEITHGDVRWDAHPDAGIDILRIHQRKDQVVNRAKKLYRERSELAGFLELGA